MNDIVPHVVVLRMLEHTRRRSCLCPINTYLPPDLSIYVHVIACINSKLLPRMSCMPLPTQILCPLEQWDVFHRPHVPCVTTGTCSDYALFSRHPWECNVSHDGFPQLKFVRVRITFSDVCILSFSTDCPWSTVYIFLVGLILFLSCYHKHFPLYLFLPTNSDFFKIHCCILFFLYILIALHMATL